jgi:hypothetical protein
MIKQHPLNNEALWCGYFLTHAQKRELINQTMREFDKPVHERKKPFQLVELVRHMIRK